MKWLTLGGIRTLEGLRREHDDSGFLLNALATHMIEPKISAMDLAAWNPADIRALALGWAQHPRGFDRELEDGDTAQAFGQAFDAYRHESISRMRTAVSPAFEAIQRQQRQMEAALAPVRGIQDVLRSVEAQRRLWESSWSRQLLETHDSFTRTKAAFQPHIANSRLTSELAAAISQNMKLRPLVPDLPGLTEALRVSAEHQTLISQLGIERVLWQPTTERLLEGVRSLTAFSDTVIHDWATGGVVPGSAAAREAPIVEVYSASRAAAELLGEEAEGSAAVDAKLDQLALIIEPALAELNSHLVDAYHGAAAAIQGRGPDHGRHMAVSLRELLMHVLHLLAPDDALRHWPGMSADDLHNGRPTRRARLRYIFREVANTTYAEFIDDDIKRAIQVIDILNGDTHQLAANATPHALRMILRRVEGILAILLEATRPAS